MITTEEVRALTDRQREVLSIVVENKLYKGKETNIMELAEQLGVAPAAVYRHLVDFNVRVLFYERLEIASPRGNQFRQCFFKFDISFHMFCFSLLLV